MTQTGRGSIVNISSMAAQSAITRVLGYSMAKAGIDNYTRWMCVELAQRYGDSIRINAIAPGFFVTNQNRHLLVEKEGYTSRGEAVIRNTPFKRFGNADELIGTLIWLLSDASVFVSGEVICVDGGFHVFSGV
jgi:NAD(P)-dependent dehydrogenase (short-subunit alcohol dehydrogenase family)